MTPEQLELIRGLPFVKVGLDDPEEHLLFVFEDGDGGHLGVEVNREFATLFDVERDDTGTWHIGGVVEGDGEGQGGGDE